MPKKKKGEQKLIMPKHMAEIPFFSYVLKVYHDHPSGIAFNDGADGSLGFKSLLKKELHDSGVEQAPSTDDSHYTKCAQLPRYFGFVRYVCPKERNGDAAITDRGERMFAALFANPIDYATIYQLLFDSIIRLQFGRRSEGVGSDSCYEPFALFFRAAKDLDGITSSEFGYLIQRLDTDFCSYSVAVKELKDFRNQGSGPTVGAETQAHNIRDWTAIKLLCNLGFLREDGQNARVSLSPDLTAQYAAKLEDLPICNRGYMAWMFHAWLRIVKNKDAQTAGNYRDSLAAMTKDVGEKNSAIFEGFFEVLTGHKPDRSVFEVKSRADYDRVYAELNHFFDMPQSKSPGGFDWAGYDECYYYTKAPQNIDNRRLYNACALYREFLTWWDNKKVDFQINDKENVVMFNGALGPIQRIAYGAPGTGKSDGINRLLNAKKIVPVRTTFHPDSDYQSFVGAYKPFMKKVQRVVYVNDGKTAQLVTGPDELKDEEVISYEFRPQAFTDAYVRAWEALVAGETMPVVLVIEEINRGDCAKIFGDLFQLLDRDDKTGFSKYPIVADRDLKDYLEKRFANPVFQGHATFEGVTAEDWDDVKAGKKLILPANLYIWATMNTSDQSLFPMDSAFKRRWDWKYVPIKEHKEESWTIELGNGKKYDWWDFLQKVNNQIFHLTSSEDKQLGYFFVKAKDKVVSLDVFVNKVVFYLWNVVFKDCYTECDFLKDGSEYLVFTKFFDGDGNARADVAAKLLDALKVTSPKTVSPGQASAVNPIPQTPNDGQPTVAGEDQAPTSSQDMSTNSVLQTPNDEQPAAEVEGQTPDPTETQGAARV